LSHSHNRALTYAQNGRIVPFVLSDRYSLRTLGPLSPAPTAERAGVFKGARAMSADKTAKTLGEYRDLCAMLTSEDSAAVKFFDDKIKAQGCDELVLADESQMLILIGALLGDRP
jgi:hypothetical protein